MNRFRTTVVTLVCVTAFLSGKTQNLVINGDFEQSFKNPCFYIYDAKVLLNSYFLGWTTPTTGTADPWYYSDTLNNQCTQNLKAYGIKTHSGIRCAGIIMSANNARFEKKLPNYREYIQTRLKTPLQKGKTYTVELFCRRHPWAGSVTNNLGFYFSVNPIGSLNFAPLPVKPQVNVEEVIRADKDWEQLGGCFVADSSYSYLTIGNFADENHLIMEIGALPNFDQLPYYLLDDVVVKETPIDKLPKPHFLGADSTLCPQQTLTLRLPDVPELTYKWQDGSDALNYTITRSGSYSVVAKLDQCVIKDTITVVVEKLFRLPPDTTFCNAEQFVIRPTSYDTRAFWSDGSQDSTLRVSQTGLYWLRVPTGYCNLADSIRVEFVGCNPFIPNVFTPNGDGKNDLFVIDPTNEKRIDWHITILNRWGEHVYEANPYHNDWDGGNLPAAVYYYLLDNRRYKRQIKGWVTIYR